jgi:cytochrome c oxidase subunit IV
MALVRRRDEERAQGRGLRIIAILAVLTLVEYFIAVGVDARMLLVVLLSVVALLKAWLIVQYFMHLPKVWQPDGGH